MAMTTSSQLTLPKPHQLVILGGDSPWTWALANKLRQRFGEIPIILEEKEPTRLFLKRRLRRLGVVTVVGQLGFAIAAKALRPLCRRQENEIVRSEGLDTKPTSVGVVRVDSANNPDTIGILNALCPQIVIVSQTRILAQRVLVDVPALFINVHTGVTPHYRGLHGAYWALARDDAGHCGITVHVVDTGIDTGPVIAQAVIKPAPSDSYFTYHWAQLAAGLPLLIRAIEDALAGQLATIPSIPGTQSGLFYHPTLWEYVWNGLRRGVW
jgi:folate-dependent phosphoribosylglycinamide formyltransferase PurN